LLARSILNKASARPNLEWYAVPLSTNPAPFAKTTPPTPAPDLASAADFNVFPNPGTGLFAIRTTETVISLLVTDLTGRKILDQKISEGHELNFRMPDNANSGVYLLQAQTRTGKVLTTKIVLNR
jgi:hypothetical protein